MSTLLAGRTPPSRHKLTRLDLRGLTITTAIVNRTLEAFDQLSPGDRVTLTLDDQPGIRPDLEAWCRSTGHYITDSHTETGLLEITLEKGRARPNPRHVAVVVSRDGLEELLSPLAFALAAAQGGARVSVYLQGPGVHLLRPGFKPGLRGLMRPFSRFARSGLQRSGHVAAIQKLRQLQRLGGRVYVCGPSLTHFRVDPTRLVLRDVTVCEYLTFMEVLEEAEVQLYA